VSGSIRDDLAAVRSDLAGLLGESDYELPLDRFQPTEHERLILRRLVDLAEIVDRLAEQVERSA
jgi:hypothetical protein